MPCTRSTCSLHPLAVGAEHILIDSLGVLFSLASILIFFGLKRLERKFAQ